MQRYQVRINNKNMDLEDVVEEKLSYIKDLELPEDWEFYVELSPPNEV